MASKAHRGGNSHDMVLESRHLVGLFLLIVVISGVVFTLGYVLGRSQYDAQVRAGIVTNRGGARVELPKVARAGPTATPAANPSTAPAAPSDWDFFRPAGTNGADLPPVKPATSVAATGKTPSASPPAAKPASASSKPLLNAPLVPRGAILLQVAALTREGDALALAELLQQKKFPSFVLTPGADHYYRVQVGPYADMQSATIAQRGLDREGFKAILKR